MPQSFVQPCPIVLLYLEGMSREGDEPDNSPPRSMVDPAEYRSKASSQAGMRSPQAIYPPAPRSKNGDGMLGLANSPINYANRQVYHQQGGGSIDGDDVDSNVQDGLRSENGDTMLPVVRVSIITQMPCTNGMTA